MKKLLYLASLLFATFTLAAPSGNVTYDARYKVATGPPPATCTLTDGTVWNGANTLNGEPTPAAVDTLQSFTATPLVPNRMYCFAVKTTDAAGNTSAMSNVATFTTLDQPVNNCGNNIIQAPEVCDGTMFTSTCKTRGFQGGGSLLCNSSCTAYDTTSCTALAWVVPKPVIQFFDVTSAPVGGYVTIRGANFGNTAGSVFMNNISATITSWVDTEITYVVPSMAVGSYAVYVHDSLGQNTGLGTVAVRSANTRYVDTATGNDSSNTCLVGGAPCATIARAILQSVAGDVILIRAGTYTITDITPTKSTQTFRGYPGEAVVVTCAQSTGSCYDHHGLFVVNSTISDIQITNMRFTNAGGDAVILDGPRGRLANSLLYGNNVNHPDSTGGSAVVTHATNTGGVVIGNAIGNNGSIAGIDRGIYTRCVNCEIAYNTVYSNLYGAAIYLTTDASGVSVHNNYLYSNDYEGILVSPGAGLTDIYNNIIALNKREGIFISNLNGARIYYNTLAWNGEVTYFGIRIATSTGSIIKNNIVLGNNVVERGPGATAPTFNSNHYYPNTSVAFSWAGALSDFTTWKTRQTGMDATSMDTNPYLVDVMLDTGLVTGFSLNQISLAINRGEPITTPSITIDFLGYPRSYGLASDRGAFEYMPPPPASGGTGGGVVRVRAVRLVAVSLLEQ